MRERPILFSAPMIRALLAGTKTATRRIVKPQPEHLQHCEYRGNVVYDGEHRLWCWKGHTYDNLIDFGEHNDERKHLAQFCPYGAAGDRLWVKETWSHDAPDLDTCRAAQEDVHRGIGYGPYYRATEVAPDTLKWRPSIYMPRWASRLTLEVVSVRVERLHEITEEDARREGVSWGGEDKIAQSAREAFRCLWDAINPGTWHASPFVWRVEFKRVEASR